MHPINRSAILPDHIAEVPAIADLTSVMDRVLWEQVDEPSLLMLDLRDLSRDDDRYVLKKAAQMMGFSKQSYYLDDNRLAKLITHLPKFRFENTTNAYKRFLSFLVEYPLGIDDLWSEDYVAFFSVAGGPKLISDLGVRHDETLDSPGWYPTTHVLIRCNPKIIFPDSTDPYADLRRLFNEIAPAYLVLEFIGNIAPLHEGRLRFNIGVVEGFNIEEYKYFYEVPNLVDSDWAQGRDLPGSLQFHAQSQTKKGEVLVTGGFAGRYQNEKTSFLIRQSYGDWTAKDLPCQNEASVTSMAYDPNSNKVIAGTSLGELLVTRDGGENWLKIYSPFFEGKEAITGLCYNSDLNVYVAISTSGRVAHASEIETWTLPTQNLGSVLNGIVHGNGVFVVVAAKSTTFRSYDGVSWTKSVIDSTHADDLNCCTFNRNTGDFLVAGNCGRAFIGANGEDWSEINPGFNDYHIYSCDYSDALGLYIIGGQNASVAISADAQIWYLRDILFRTTDVRYVAFLDGLGSFIAVGDGKYASSLDGYNWNLYPYPFTSFEGTASIALCGVTVPEGLREIVGGTNATAAIAKQTEKLLLVEDMSIARAHHQQATLLDGRVLVCGGESQGSTFNQTAVFDTVAGTWSNKDNLNVAVKCAGISVIPDVSTADAWTPRNSKFGYIAINDFEYLPGSDKFVAVGDMARVSESAYGLTWNLVNSPFPVQNLVGAAYEPTNNRYSLLANSTPYTKIELRISTDEGEFWSDGFTTAPPANTVARDFEFLSRMTPGLFVLSSQFDSTLIDRDVPLEVTLPSGEVVTRSRVNALLSETGQDFQPTGFNEAAMAPDLYDMCYAKEIGVYVVTSIGGIHRSTDRSQWDFIPIGGAVDPILSAQYGGGVFMAVALSGSIYVSLDGAQTWSTSFTPDQPGVSNSYLSAVDVSDLFDAGAWIASGKITGDEKVCASLVYVPGTKTWLALGPSGIIWRSTDFGMEWTESNSGGGGSTSIRPMAYAKIGNVEYVAAGLNGRVYWTTNSGVSWSQLTLNYTTNTSQYDEGNRGFAITWCPKFNTTGRWLMGSSKPWMYTADFSQGSHQNASGPGGNEIVYTIVAGDLPAGAYQYAVSGFDEVGESLASQFSVTLPDSSEGVGVSISWRRWPGLKGYKVYGRKNGMLFLLKTITDNLITNFVDDGTIAPDVTQPRKQRATSGLSRLYAVDDTEFGDTPDKIAAITYSRQLGMAIIVLRNGHVSYSDTGVLWYTQANRSYTDSVKRVYSTDSDNLYISACDNSYIGTSLDGLAWTYTQFPSLPDFTAIGYSRELDTVIVGTESSNYAYSKGSDGLLGGNLELNVTSDVSQRAQGEYFYTIVKEVESGSQLYLSTRSEAAYFNASTANTFFARLTWEADPDATAYRIYRSDASVPFNSVGIVWTYLGRVPAVPGYVGPMWYEDQYDSAADSVTFAGAGLSDLSVSATTMTSMIGNIIVRIAADGVPDSWQWVYEYLADDESAWSDPLDMVAGWVNIAPLNLRIAFGATTGHTPGNRWFITAIKFPLTQPSVQLPLVNTSYRFLGQTWLEADTEVSPLQFTRVEYLDDPYTDNRGFVALGKNGVIAISETGEPATWQQMNLHNDVTGSHTLTGISAAIIGGRYQAVITGSQQFLAHTPSFYDTVMSRVDHAFPEGVNHVRWNPELARFVACGDQSSLGTSSNGTFWRMAFVSGLASFRKAGNGFGNLAAIVVGDYGTVATSFDGDVWVKRDIGYGSGNISCCVSGTGASDVSVIMAGDGGQVVWSMDGGVNYLPGDPTNVLGVSDITSGTFCEATQMFTVVNKAGRVFYSNDGYTWTPSTITNTHPFVCIKAHPDPTSTKVLAITSIGEVFRSNNGGLTWALAGKTQNTALVYYIGANDTRWVVASDDGKIYYSLNDGSTWTEVSVPIKPFLTRRNNPNANQRIDFRALTFGGGFFVIVGDEGDVLISADATSWVWKDSKLGGINLHAAGFGANTFLIGGDRGAIATSFTGFNSEVLLTGGSGNNNLALDGVYSYNVAGNAWTTETDTLLTARQNHAQCTMPDGTVLVAGGVDPTGEPLVTTERYLPHRNLWVADIDMPYAKSYLRGQATPEGSVILTGAGPDPTASALVYVPTVVPPLPPVLKKGPGLLQPGSYYYRVSVSTVSGETLPTEPIKITLDEVAGVVIDWEAVPNAVEYRIYGRDASAAALIDVIPGHLTSFADLGVQVSPSGTFKRVDSSRDEWFEVQYEQPLPREGHTFTMFNSNTFLQVGGYCDYRMWRMTVNPYSFVRSTAAQQDLDNPSNLYVDQGYVIQTPPSGEYIDEYPYGS